MPTAPPIILIVDDTPAFIVLLRKFLEGSYRVLTATSGRLALQIAASEPRPDLILLDVMMPEMDGYMTLKLLRENPVTEKIPVIFVSALENSVDQEHGLALGAADYVFKPFKSTVLLKRIKLQLEKNAAASPKI